MNRWRLRVAALILATASSVGAAEGQGFTFSELPPPDPQPSGLYGWAVTLSQDGETALVGAQRHTQGRAYVFTRTSAETWELETRLPPLFPSSGFGNAVALSADGSVALVGDSSFPCSFPFFGVCGAAYVFVRQSGGWVQEARFGPQSVGDLELGYGSAVALSADGLLAMVSQTAGSCSGLLCPGGVFIYQRDSGGVWSPAGSLRPSNLRARFFGVSIALSPDGNRVLIGAPGTECSAGFGCGTAYVFNRGGGVWTEQVELTASTRRQGAFFGTSAALAADGTSALIGAPGNAIQPGFVHALFLEGGTWTERQEITTDRDDFGERLSLSLDGRTALVGASQTDCTDNDNCGAAYRIGRRGDLWSSPQSLLNFASGDLGGFSVALSGDGETGLIGAPGRDCAAGDSCGTVYVLSALPAPEPGIPTASHLGLALLALLLAASGARVLARRRSV